MSAESQLSAVVVPYFPEGVALLADDGHGLLAGLRPGPDWLGGSWERCRFYRRGTSAAGEPAMAARLAAARPIVMSDLCMIVFFQSVGR